MKPCIIASFLAALVVTSACGSSYRNVRPDDRFEPRVLVLDGKKTDEDLRLAVSRGLADRDFAITSEEPQQVAATLASRRVSIDVVVSYSPTQVTIAYASSKGLSVTEDGRAPQFEKQARALEASIREALNKKPKPVAAAEAEPKPKAKRPPPSVAVFPRPLEWEDARAALRRGLAEHGWVVEDEGAFGTWIVRLDHGDERIRLTAELSTVSVELAYKDSIGIDFDKDARSPVYERWIRNIVVAIEDAARN